MVFQLMKLPAECQELPTPTFCCSADEEGVSPASTLIIKAAQ